MKLGCLIRGDGPMGQREASFLTSISLPDSSHSVKNGRIQKLEGTERYILI